MTLTEKHASSPKLSISKARVFSHWASLSDEERLAGFNKDAALYKASTEQLLKIGLDKGAQVDDEASGALSAKHANEYIKLRMKVLKGGLEKAEKVALQALEKEGQAVHDVENLLRRLIKSGSDAKAFKAKAKQIYKYASAFE